MMHHHLETVQHPLMILFPLKPGTRGAFIEFLTKDFNPVADALDEHGLTHFLSVIPLPKQALILAEFDGEAGEYIAHLNEALGAVFIQPMIEQFVEGATSLDEMVSKYSVPPMLFYAAYPEITVEQIWAEFGAPADEDTIQNTYNVILPMRAGVTPEQVQAVLTQLMTDGVEAIARVEATHFLRVVLFDNMTKLGIFSVYDGDPEAYDLELAEKMGDAFFDPLLKNFVDKANFLPVAKHAEDFADYMTTHHAVTYFFYSASPSIGVEDILWSLGDEEEEEA
ncbi:MAG: hypothetical protein ACOYL5_06080 [Phototrophicaceae bacterium]